LPRELQPASVSVLKPGMFSTVQDLGRHGYQKFGVPVSGAMDPFSCRLANRIVCNKDDAGVLEITVKGPDLLFHREAVIGITGGDLSPHIDNDVIPTWTTVLIKAGSILTFGARKSGARAYLAIAGGIEVPCMLGSRSTHVPSEMGGIGGGALFRGASIHGGPPSSHARFHCHRAISPQQRPTYRNPALLRFVPGPEDKCFLPDALVHLTNNPYVISSDSNRMGYRLTGPRLMHKRTADTISDATPLGSLQVPGDQQPILLMADRQTTGGYTRIGIVISADISMAGQLLPGESVAFEAVGMQHAINLLKTQREFIEQLSRPWSRRS
jgi:antagonist of KipI